MASGSLAALSTPTTTLVRDCLDCHRRCNNSSVLSAIRQLERVRSDEDCVESAVLFSEVLHLCAWRRGWRAADFGAWPSEQMGHGFRGGDPRARVVVLVRWGIHRDEQSGAPIGIALIVDGLLFDARITQGRVFLGYFAASASRDTTNDVLVLVGIYLTVLATPSRTPAEHSDIAADAAPEERVEPPAQRLADLVARVPVKPVIAVVIVVEIVASLSLAFAGARNLHQIEVTAQSATRNIDREPAEKVVADLYFVRSKSWLVKQTEFLRTHHLSQFG